MTANETAPPAVPDLGDTETLYGCCDHCEHDGEIIPGEHTDPCPDGCDTGTGAA